MVFLIGLAACMPDNLIWTEAYNFSGSRWKGDKVITFIPDTTSLLPGDARKGVITLRYGANADVESFPMIVEIESPHTGEYRCDTIKEILLPAEKRNGNRSSAGVFEITDTIHFRQPVNQGWRISFRQPLRESEVNGLFSLVFTLER